MPVINHSFASRELDPFSNVTVEVTDDKVRIGASTYEKCVSVNLSHDEARRLVQTLTKELNRATQPND